jgi:hypothetical protein
MSDPHDEPPGSAIELDASFYRPITVVIPDTSASSLRTTIEPASGAVVIAPETDLALVYYQPASSRAVNVVTFADRVMIAHGRAWSDVLRPGASGQPSTINPIAVDAAALIQIGSYDPREGEITPSSEQARDALAAWLDTPAHTDQFNEQLRTTTAQHDLRRALRTALADPASQRVVMERLAREHGHGDLLEHPPTTTD